MIVVADVPAGWFALAGLVAPAVLLIVTGAPVVLTDAEGPAAVRREQAVRAPPVSIHNQILIIAVLLGMSVSVATSSMT